MVRQLYYCQRRSPRRPPILSHRASGGKRKEPHSEYSTILIPNNNQKLTKKIRNLGPKSQIGTAAPWPYICGFNRLSDFPTYVGPSSRNGDTFFPRNFSANQAGQQSSMIAVADHVIARNFDPGVAVMLMLLPSTLMRLVTLEARFVARLEARSRNMKAS